MDSSHPHRSDVGRVVMGFVLIGIGAIFLLERQGIIEVQGLGHYWPFILVALGLARLVDAAAAEDERSRRARGAVWLLFLGALFTAHEFTEYGVHELWPLFLVAIGIGIIWKALEGRHHGA